MKALPTIAAFGILLALLWIGYEIHQIRRGGLSVDGSIDASGQMSVSGSIASEVQGQGGMPIEVEIER